MNKKGVIIHLDNERTVLETSKNLFDQNALNLDYIICSTHDEFNTILQENESYIKVLIFDLLSREPDAAELHQQDAEFLKTIEDNFASFNVPIFIYSGYLQAIEGRFNGGTVFKVDKGSEDFQDNIINKISLLFESGFIDVFCPGGVLESEIRQQLNQSFTKQFSNNKQIEDVIGSIKSVVGQDDLKERIRRVFVRIAVKTLASELLAPVVDSEDNVHPVEHFYRRQSKIEVWTGDIWCNKHDGHKMIVLTPRCDLAVGKAKCLILCRLEASPQFNLNAKPEKLLKELNNYLVDNIDGKAKRYIPDNVFLPDGGIVNLANHETQPKDVFLNDYNYLITLSDDLTNEIIGKFAYYFLRTGITNINVREFEAAIKKVNDAD